jgi:hypothetical protein
VTPITCDLPDLALGAKAECGVHMDSCLLVQLHATPAIRLRRYWRQVAAAAQHRRARCRIVASSWGRQSPAVAVPPTPAPQPPAR